MPFQTLYFLKAIIAYSEQVGTNLHFGLNLAGICSLYLTIIFIKKFIILETILVK